MPVNSTGFIQPCPVCGRLLQVSVRLLGKRAACHHCEATFVAREDEPQSALMKRADALLNACSKLHPVGLVDPAMQDSRF